MNNVAISVDTGRIRLVNIGVTRMLKDLNAIHSIVPNPADFSSDEESWRPPEIILKSGQAGKKADIWNCGIVLAQLMFGLSVQNEFESIDDFLAKINCLRPPLRDIFSLMLDRYIAALGLIRNNFIGIQLRDPALKIYSVTLYFPRPL